MNLYHPRKIQGLLFVNLIIIIGTGCDRSQTLNENGTQESGFRISGMHTLSIHTRDTVTVNSIYNYLNEELKLPVYYTPVTIGMRKYAGIYAGNMVLEPCGPYENREYARDDFRAIFYGINFSVNDSLKYFDKTLNELGIGHQANKGSIYIRDSLLSNENIFTALYEIRDKNQRDSLKSCLNSTTGGPGIEYIKEIVIGYKGEENIRKWKEYFHPLEIQNSVYRINDSLQIRFEQNKINEIKSITFKVKSLIKARQFLADNHIKFEGSLKQIRLDPDEIFGLIVFLE